jgi:sarcosine oxidase subunit beta
MKRHFDILIVGGGIFGASLFHYCLKETSKRVALFEKNKFCSGATGRAGGLIKFLHTSDKLCKLAASSFIEFNQFAQNTGQSCDFFKTGFFTIEKEQQLPEIKKKINLLHDFGIKIECLTKDDFKARFNHFHFPEQENVIVLYEQESGYANPVKATQAYLSAGIDAGGLAFENIEVLDILTKNNKIIGIDTSYGSFEAPCVVLATGACSNQLLNKIGITTPKLINKVIQVDFYKYPQGIPPLPSFIDKIIGLYGFDYGNQQCLLGTTTEFMPTRNLLSFERTQIATQLAAKHWPWINTEQWIGGRTGTDAYTENGEGVAHFSPQISGLFLCMGWSGVGFKMAPACAKEAAYQISADFFNS